jgi:AcrR family transcriptional regulator
VGLGVGQAVHQREQTAGRGQRAFSEEGTAANLADVAVAAGVSRATLYRYYPNREALLKALGTHALTELASRLNDAGLERATAKEAVERLARAHASGVRRGITSGLLRQDLPAAVLLELFAGTIMAAIKLTQRQQLGPEEASAAAAAVFLDGARPR